MLEFSVLAKKTEKSRYVHVYLKFTGNQNPHLSLQTRKLELNSMGRILL